jgi:transposase InsO family protein
MLPKRIKAETVNKIDELRAARGTACRCFTIRARAGDITCIRTGEGFPYPSLMMDLWSRKIVGFHAGDTLEAEGAVRALETALSGLPKGMFPVRHSDRGCQYCPHRYVDRLRARGLPASMTEDTRCYENARAERDIETGIQPWLFVSEQKTGACGGWGAVSLYNTRRPRLSLNYETPETMHRRAA